MEHVFHGASNCDVNNCFICEGGLGLCLVCGQAEIELTPECPGYPLDAFEKKLRKDQLWNTK